MISVVSPAPFHASLAMLDMTALKPLQARVATYQAALAKTFGFSHGEQLLAVLSLWPSVSPSGDVLDEVSLWTGPPAQLAPHMVPLARAVHLTLLRRGQSTGRRQRAFVSAGHSPGARMARMAGFGLLSPSSAPNGFEIWERDRWENSPNLSSGS